MDVKTCPEEFSAWMIIKSVYNDYTLYIYLPNVHYLSSCFVILFVCNCLPQMPVHSHCALFVIGNEACFSGKYNQLTFPLHLPFTDDARIRHTFLLKPKVYQWIWISWETELLIPRGNIYTGNSNISADCRLDTNFLAFSSV